MNFLKLIYLINRSCGELTVGDGGYDCDNPLAGGVAQRVGLINKADISSITYSSTTPNLITAFTLKTGKVMHVFNGFKNFLTPSTETVDNPSGPSLYKHNVNFFILKNSQLIKNQIQRMGKGSFIVVFQNAQENNDAFEVMGVRNGLELQPGAINNKNENSGAYNIILASRAGNEEPMLPQTWLSTDFATTRTAFETLGAIPTVTNISDLAIGTAGGDAETITGTAFHGGGSASAVESVRWVNVNTLAETTQTGYTVASNTSITFNSVALAAGVYKLRVYTTRGVGESVLTVTVS
jgi:hypothetical protein